MIINFENLFVVICLEGFRKIILTSAMKKWFFLNTKAKKKVISALHTVLHVQKFPSILFLFEDDMIDILGFFKIFIKLHSLF